MFTPQMLQDMYILNTMAKDTNGKKIYQNDDKDVDVVPIKYDALVLIKWQTKKMRHVLRWRLKSAEFIIFTDEDGNDQVFEENGKEYLVCQVWYHLGKILSTDNV